MTSIPFQFQKLPIERHSVMKNESLKIDDSSQAHKSKIENLHKMLDHQIQTVNTLFDKDNAFQQIQEKLKQLQVKLNSIKEDSSINLQRQFKSQYNSNEKDFFSKINNTDRIQQKLVNVNTPFQSLSKYKKNKNKQQKSINESGKKLNFDIDQQNQQNRTSLRKKQKKQTKKHKIKRNKSIQIINANDINSRSGKKRSKSSNQNAVILQNFKSQSRPLSRQNSQKKQLHTIKRTSISKSSKKQIKTKNQKQKSTGKKLNISKTTANLSSWKKIEEVYGGISRNSSKPLYKINQKNHQQKIKEITRNIETKKLEEKLKSFKAKNENLQNQVKQLKNYKQQFQKLKSIFQKEEKVRKFRKNL